MKMIVTIFILTPLLVYPQSSSFNFRSSENIKKFADHLFCEGDYLRANEQYELIKNQLASDTTEFKVMLGYSTLGLYQESNEIFERFNDKSYLYPDAYLISLKNKILIESKLIKA